MWCWKITEVYRKWKRRDTWKWKSRVYVKGRRLLFWHTVQGKCNSVTEYGDKRRVKENIPSKCLGQWIELSLSMDWEEEDLGGEDLRRWEFHFWTNLTWDINKESKLKYKKGIWRHGFGWQSESGNRSYKKLFEVMMFQEERNWSRRENITEPKRNPTEGKEEVSYWKH